MKNKIGAVLTYVGLTFGANAVYASTSVVLTQVNGEHGSAEVEKILGELNRQQDSASDLVRSVREPSSLALQSSLVANKQNKQSSASEVADDVLGQLTAVASSAVSKFKQTGLASWYGRQFHGKKTASGERFDMNALTAAHRSLPMNCYIKVTNKDNGKSVVVRVNDRGPFHGNRVLDLSYGAAKAIGITQKGVGNVTIERVNTP